MNPKLKDFLEDYQDMTLIGFAWACYWRLWLAIGGVYVCFFVAMIFLAGIGELFS